MNLGRWWEWWIRSQTSAYKCWYGSEYWSDERLFCLSLVYDSGSFSSQPFLFYIVPLCLSHDVSTFLFPPTASFFFIHVFMRLPRSYFHQTASFFFRHVSKVIWILNWWGNLSWIGARLYSLIMNRKCWAKPIFGLLYICYLTIRPN